MGLLQLVCMGLPTIFLEIFAHAQEFSQGCNAASSPVTVGSTEDLATLAASLDCSNGEFAVRWVGEISVAETIHVTNGTSLNITGDGSESVAEGGDVTQLFYVNRGSSLHLSNMILANGNASGSYGGAIHVEDSSISFSGSTSFISNSAGEDGGAIYASYSTVSWNGGSVLFIANSAGGHGGAIRAEDSTVSWDGDGTEFISNFAGNDGGAISASDDSIVIWDGDGTVFTSNSAGDDGGAIAVRDSYMSWDGDGTLFTSNSAGVGGAISVYDSDVSWDGDSTQFSNNSAGDEGGAISVSASATGDSTMYWIGDGTLFTNNSAGLDGGALYVTSSDSTVSWGGDGTFFTSNFAGAGGGAIAAYSSILSWDGDGTLFISNFAGNEGGAIAAYENPDESEPDDATVSWHGESTLFRDNSAEGRGGAIYGGESSAVSWEGDTIFSSNYAGDGGAICASFSTVSWDGNGTVFTSNNAVKDGGAIYAMDSRRFFWNGTPTFSYNVAGAYGGALAMVDIQFEHHPETFTAATFIENRAGYGGGALYMLDCESPLNFTGVTFQSNFAGGAGGAVTAQLAGDASSPVAFSGCTFAQNVAGNSGGAVEVLAGHQTFDSCHFEGNSADIGGAMLLAANLTVVRECSFFSNSVSSRGLAIAVGGSVDTVASADISGSTFDGNELYCPSGLFYREDTEEGGPNQRFEAVCFDCPDWIECSGCTMTSGDVKPVCEVPLEHTTAEGSGVTLETLSIARGYWRATGKSETILACYNADACIGGRTGEEGYCSPGYTGPYCAVCETGYSSSLGYTCTRCSTSRRQGLMIAIVIGALIVVLAVVFFCRYLLSMALEEEETGCFYRRVIQAVPLQAVKIVVVVWQILTQFAEVANITYPGVYQDFINAINIINFDLGSVLAAGCLWSEIDFHGRLLVSTLGPLVAVGLLSVTYWIAMRRVGAKVDRAGVVEIIRRKHQTALLLLTFLVYSAVSSTVFQTFACETLDDGVEYLRADYRIQCTDAKHKSFEVYAGFMILVYPLGIPLLYTIQLFQHRDVLADAGEDKVAAQAISGLWEPYRPERFYYEVVECGRRVMLTGVVVFIFPGDAAQVAITMLIAFLFFGILEVLSPYESESDMWLSRAGHALVFLSMFYLLLLKVDVSGERDESQAAFAGVFVAGHVLMVIVILVEVLVEVTGICYASRNDKEDDGNSISSESPQG
eukprot:g7321.t1